jgi:hypothetical protein
MNWLRNLLRKPAAKPLAPTIAPAAKPAAEDVAALRRALAGAVETEYAALAARLGRALAEASLPPQADDPPAAWVAAIRHAPDKTLALAWLDGLHDEIWLGEVAKQAQSAEIRYLAAQRITSTAMLEQTAFASRDKDKRVYRHCADLLKQRRELEINIGRTNSIADELRALLASAPLPQTRLFELQKEISNVGEAGAAREECDALFAQAQARMRLEAEARRDLQQHLNLAVALASECAHATWPWSEQIDAWQARYADLSQAKVPDWLAGQATYRELNATLQSIENHLAALAVDDERVLAGEHFLAPLAADVAPDAETVTAWNALARPNHPDAWQPLALRWQELPQQAPAAPVVSEAPASPKPAQRAKAHIDQEAVRSQLDQLEQAIEQGHLAAADTAAKQIKTLLGSNSLQGALATRLQGLQARLDEMRGWARWGTVQVREQLVASAQALLEGEHDVDELAHAIPKLRDEWKRLNPHGPAAKGQWESFDAALEQAYLPVAAHRAEQAARQAEALGAKEALCAELEAAVAGIAWETADFKLVENLRAQLIQQWRAAPAVSFRAEQGLRKRFDAQIAGLDQKLDAARAAEIERREQIIASASALSEQVDLRQAMNAAKALQERWNQPPLPVRLKRGDEQQLWQRFRAACDAVFARNATLRAEQSAQLQARAQARQQLLDAFAATLADSDDSKLKQALAQFRSDWDAAKPAAREAGDNLDNQAQELQATARQRLDAVRQGRYRAQFEVMAQKAGLSERIETLAAAGEPLDTVVAEVNQAWDELPQLPGKNESLLAQRLAAASKATRADLASGQDARNSMLLDLEIALGLPSPENYAVIRSKRQLEQLQNRFHSAQQGQSEPESMLLRCYATAALADPACAPRMHAIIRSLVEQDAAAHR